MDFKKIFPKSIFMPLFIVVFVIGMIVWRFCSRTDPSISENVDTSSSLQDEPSRESLVRPSVQNLPAEEGFADDVAIEKQLDQDREEQKKTKDLRIQLEQTNLELEQEKALAEINKLKMDNKGIFKEPVVDGPNNLPEIKVEYIGGDSVKKEAILSIAGTSYQIKEKSSPIDNIQILSISDSGVTLHISDPVNITKTIDYKPE